MDRLNDHSKRHPLRTLENWLAIGIGLRKAIRAEKRVQSQHSTG
jgi:hypothetical protein